MCLKGLFFIVFIAFFGIGAYADDKAIENEKNEKQTVPVSLQELSLLGTCTASLIGDQGSVYCQITRYCGIFGGTATLESGPLDSPPCTCICR